MKIFGIKLDKYDKESLLKKISKKIELSNFKSFFIITINPEILLSTRRDRIYKKIVNSADIRIIDGFGIKLVSWLKKRTIGARITGVDLANFLIKKSERKNLETTVLFLKDGLSSEEYIRKYFKKFKKIQLIAIKNKENPNFNEQLLCDSKLVLVALGHPYQEILISKLMLRLSENKIFMGIGGSLDFWTKRKKRAPKILRIIGMEWLWRLIIQPNRLNRTFNATVKFPILAILNHKND